MAKTGFTKNLKQEELNMIISMYQNGTSTSQIAKHFNTSKTTIGTLLKNNGIKLNKNGISQRKYYVDEYYFDNIDTPNKAYILGFLYADGCNFTPRHLVRLSLQEKDYEILEKIRLEIKSEKELIKRDKNWKSNQGIYTLELQSKHMSNQLEKLGCPNNKSLILKFPNFISKELLSHFLRGYFDGDGYIQDPEKRSNCTMVNIVSSKIFTEELSKFLLEELGIENHIRIMQNPKTATLYITKTSEVKKFCDYIYKDAKLYMKRKHNKYLKKFYPELLINN